MIRAVVDRVSLAVLREILRRSRRGGPIGKRGRKPSPALEDRDWSIFSEWSADGWGPSARILAERHGLAHNRISEICRRLERECVALTALALGRLDGIQPRDLSIPAQPPCFGQRPPKLDRLDRPVRRRACFASR